MTEVNQTRKKKQNTKQTKVKRTHKREAPSTAQRAKKESQKDIKKGNKVMLVNVLKKNKLLPSKKN